jgi:chromosome segregation ATPase
MTKTKQHEPQQTVAACEQTLKELEAKRAKLVERGAELAELRRGAAYLAHVQRDAEARRALDKVNAEVATYASELASIDDAIAAAKNKVLIAQAFEATAADRARAARALEILGAFREAGHELDDALRTITETGTLLGNLLPQLHAAGVKSPTYEQLDALGYQAFATAIMATPWHRRFEPLAPNQRKTFRSLFDAWVMAIGPRLKAQLGKKENEAA